MTGHTPGPWKIEPECAYGWDIYSGEYPKRLWVADAKSPHNSKGFPPREEGLANAHLIAAAPELLTALKLVRSMVGAPHDFTIADIWNAQKKADEVIAKAEAAKVT
ncbi:hypothetical protein LCGC14_3157400, partial [marine sediment metagenome]